MKTAKRFTPARLERWHRLGRGTGHGASYQPWHQITRDDPASRGRSHLVNWPSGRLLHLLSDLELVTVAFATMHPGLLDLAEQYPLQCESSLELDPRSLGDQRWFDGTRDIAAHLGLRHPGETGNAQALPWVMTTDLVLTLTASSGKIRRVAICAKFDIELAKRRTLELLTIEREYWRRRNVEWLLLTPALYDQATTWLLRSGIAWAFGSEQVSPALLVGCTELAAEFQHRSNDAILALLQQKLGIDHATAQATFWQSVWRGAIWLKLSQALRPFAPMRFLSNANAFWQQNPIVAGRSSWI